VSKISIGTRRLALLPDPPADEPPPPEGVDPPPPLELVDGCRAFAGYMPRIPVGLGSSSQRP
jgi:hypothetical protein